MKGQGLVEYMIVLVTIVLLALAFTRWSGIVLIGLGCAFAAGTILWGAYASYHGIKDAIKKGSS